MLTKTEMVRADGVLRGLALGFIISGVTFEFIGSPHLAGLFILLALASLIISFLVAKLLGIPE